MNDYEYKGHTITLVPGREGYMWVCEYVIKKSDETEMGGFPDGDTYDAREKAEIAALARAKALIDESNLNKVPLGS